MPRFETDYEEQQHGGYISFQGFGGINRAELAPDILRALMALDKGGRDRVSAKIRHLIREEGKPQKQAVATALNMEREGRLRDDGTYRHVSKAQARRDLLSKVLAPDDMDILAKRTGRRGRSSREGRPPPSARENRERHKREMWEPPNASHPKTWKRVIGGKARYRSTPPRRHHIAHHGGYRERVSTVVGGRHGHYAVHRNPDGDYGVTHVPSGASLGHFDTAHEATSLAKYLHRWDHDGKEGEHRQDAHASSKFGELDPDHPGIQAIVRDRNRWLNVRPESTYVHKADQRRELAMELFKGKSYPIGTVREWKNGPHMKVPAAKGSKYGKWIPVAREHGRWVPVHEHDKRNHGHDLGPTGESEEDQPKGPWETLADIPDDLLEAEMARRKHDRRTRSRERERKRKEAEAAERDQEALDKHTKMFDDLVGNVRRPWKPGDGYVRVKGEWQESLDYVPDNPLRRMAHSDLIDSDKAERLLAEHAEQIMPGGRSGLNMATARALYDRTVAGGRTHGNPAKVTTVTGLRKHLLKELKRAYWRHREVYNRDRRDERNREERRKEAEEARKEAERREREQRERDRKHGKTWKRNKGRRSIADRIFGTNP